MSSDNKLVHFTAGAVSGTLGSIVTCPLDVAKTRLQSSRVDTYRPVDNTNNNNINNKNVNNINNNYNNTNNKLNNNFYNNIKNINKNFKNTNKNTGKSERFKNIVLKRTYSTKSIQHKSSFKNKLCVQKKHSVQNKLYIQYRMRFMSTFSAANLHNNQSVGFINCIKHIVHTEGYRALFKGLMPTLFGVAPARAIYFTTYEHCKKTYSSTLVTSSSSYNNNTYQQSLVHLLSAASAGVTCTSITNPIWMIRTRLQLNNKSGDALTTLQCIRNIHQQHGLRGFYKGLTASYFGVTETAIHFVIYEAIKAKIVNNREKSIMINNINANNAKSLSTMSSESESSSSSSLLPSSSSSSSSLTNTPISQSSPTSRPPPSSTSSLASSPPTSKTPSTYKPATPIGACAVDGDEEDFLALDKQVLSQEVPPMEFLKYMLAASVSKTIATFLAYPHEVARTRMREGNPKYTTFFGTLVTVAREEGARALYRGLVTQLIKHIPNTAIVLTTYEAVVYLCNKKGF